MADMRSPMYEVGMTATDGRLAEILHELRAENHSYEAIARILEERYGLTVSFATVKNWLERYPAEGPAA